MSEPGAAAFGEDAAMPPYVTHSPESLERLDRAFLRMRRVLVHPEIASLPVPSLGRTIDLAKVLACMAIDESPDILGQTHAPTVKDVATLLELDHSTASRVLTEAESEGLIVRRTDPDDRRRTTVELTDAGRAVVADSSAMRTWAIGSLLADWSTDDVATLTALLDRLRETFTERMPVILEQAHAALAAAEGGPGQS